jgi:hypothetical protein
MKTGPDALGTAENESIAQNKKTGPEHIFDGTEGVGSRFYVLRSQTHFRRYRGRLVLFSCFAHPDSFWAVLRASGQIFMFTIPDLFCAVSWAADPVCKFCASGLVFDYTEGVGSNFHVYTLGLVLCCIVGGGSRL